MRYLTLTLICIFAAAAATAQEGSEPRLVGGPCEGGEAVLEHGDAALAPIDTLPGFHAPGPRLHLHGTVYEPDGKTPAAGIVLYAHHTDREGRYTPAEGATGWARRHGRLRGWVRTGDDGRYAFYTSRPAAYPSRTLPAHVHLTVLEPDGRYYWLGSVVFAGDPLLGPEERSDTPRGGGSRVVELVERDGVLQARRDIVLGRNVPGYE